LVVDFTMGGDVGNDGYIFEDLCLDERYEELIEIESQKNESYQLLKLINGYISYLRNQKTKDTH